ncbi:MAG: tripartite tricarboxylate transporter permease [Alphaproteobacteria bacterium]
MLDVIASTFVNLFTGTMPLYVLLGVAVGLIVGILPALGTTAGMALLVPFVYGMEPTQGLAMMIGLLAVVATGDTVTSVLMGIPGATSSQATVLDGFPMARKGEAARALSAAYFSSMVGGVFGALVLTCAIIAARPVILAFGTGEMLMLVILGITMVSILSGASLVKGFVSCGLGLTLGALGTAPATGEMRLMIGNDPYLSEGIPLAVVALGIFAVPEIINILRQGEAISDRAPLGRGWGQGIMDTWRNRWLVLRCSVIGVVIGALPIGGSDWFAYGHAVQSSKNRENFGKGDVRGVLAPEAANNANAGGALVPTLIFGIPGSGSTAVLLGGLILIGIQPGPSMLDEHLDLTYTIIWSLALANIFGAGACFLISGHMAKITAIPFVYVAPFLMMVIFFGAFQSTRHWGDLLCLFVVGMLGTFLRRFGYARPAFLIGFVLQHNIETLLYQTIQIYSLVDLFSRPLMWVLLSINVASMVVGLKFRPTLETEGKSRAMTASEMTPQIVFLGLAIAGIAYTFYDVWGMSFLGRIFPLCAGVLVLIFAFIGLIELLRRNPDSPMTFDSEVGWRGGSEGYKVGLYYYIGWLTGFMVLIALFGFLLAIAIFFVIFLRNRSDARWISIGIMAGCAVGALTLLSYVFTLQFPTGVLQDLVAMPWPFD